MADIFISYRRRDVRSFTGRLYSRLGEKFGPDLVFMDVRDIEPGYDFRGALAEQLDRCRLLLVIIGPGWLDERDDHGNRRIDSHEDYVQSEIRTGLSRSIPVIPVLAEGARFPAEKELPVPLRGLVFRQNVVIRDDPHWDADVDLLCAAIKKRLDSTPGRRLRPDANTAAFMDQLIHEQQSLRRLLFGVMSTLILVAALVIVGYCLFATDKMTPYVPMLVSACTLMVAAYPGVQYRQSGLKLAAFTLLLNWLVSGDPQRIAQANDQINRLVHRFVES